MPDTRKPTRESLDPRVPLAQFEEGVRMIAKAMEAPMADVARACQALVRATSVPSWRDTRLGVMLGARDEQ